MGFGSKLVVESLQGGLPTFLNRKGVFDGRENFSFRGQPDHFCL